jgi:diamine N-acetyltransferase
MEAILENKLIRLRAPEPEDLDFFYKWENNTSLWSVGNTIRPYSRYELRQYIASSNDIYESRQMRLVIELKNDNKEIGAIDLYDFDPVDRRAAVGIFIDHEHQNNGYASSALSLCADYSFIIIGMHQLYAYIPVNNERSIALFKSCGFVQRGVLADWLKSPDRYDDVMIVSLISGL